LMTNTVPFEYIRPPTGPKTPKWQFVLKYEKLS